VFLQISNLRILTATDAALAPVHRKSNYKISMATVQRWIRAKGPLGATMVANNPSKISARLPDGREKVSLMARTWRKISTEPIDVLLAIYQYSLRLKAKSGRDEYRQAESGEKEKQR
jgi:hypothetical protein